MVAYDFRKVFTICAVLAFSPLIAKIVKLRSGGKESVPVLNLNLVDPIVDPIISASPSRAKLSSVRSRTRSAGKKTTKVQSVEPKEDIVVVPPPVEIQKKSTSADLPTVTFTPEVSVYDSKSHFLICSSQRAN